MLEESLSSKEKIIYDLYLEHKSYKEIMDDLGVENPKMIDNAIQRVKRKIERIKEIDWSNINTKNN
jgi:DNA-binding CsgD family transcriptional regulator